MVINLSPSFWFMWKKGLRTFTKNKRKVLPVILLMIFTIGFGSAMYEAVGLEMELVEESIEIHNFADGFVYTDPLPASYLTDHPESLMGNLTNNYIRSYESRLVLPVDFIIDGKSHEGLLVGINLSLSQHINKLVNLEKEELQKLNRTMTYSFTSSSGMEIGDNFTVSYGKTNKTFKINNIGVDPEWDFNPIRKDVVFPSMDAYPVFYLPIQNMSDWFLDSPIPIANQILYHLKNGIEHDDVEDELEKNLGDNLNLVIHQEDHPYISFLRADAEGGQIMITFILVIFAIGSVIILIVVIHKLVESDLTSLSVFQGLGAKKGEIIGGYFIFTSLNFIISIIFGSLLGTIISYQFDALIYDMIRYPFPLEVEYSFMINFYLGLFLFTLLIISTYLVVRKSFTMEVQESMKYETKYLKKVPLAERLANKIRKNLHPLAKFNLRKIFSKKLFLFFLLASMTISVTFMYFATGLPDSFTYTLNRKLTEIDKWDGVATTWEYETRRNMNNSLLYLYGGGPRIHGLEDHEFGIVDTLQISRDNSSYDDYIGIMAYQNHSKLHELKVNQGELMDEQNETVISQDLLSKYSLKLEDTLFVKRIGTNSSVFCQKLTITGVIDDLTGNTIYTLLSDAQIILNHSQRVNTIYFTVNEDANINKTKAELLDDDKIQGVVLKRELMKDLETYFQLMPIFTYVLGGMFLVFGLTVIGVIIKNLVEYRRPDYVSMKAIGLSNRKIMWSLFKEIGIYCLITYPLGIILGNYLLGELFRQYSAMMPGFVVHVYPASYLYFTFLITTMILLVLLFQYRRLRKINIAETTMSKDFG